MKRRIFPAWPIPAIVLFALFSLLSGRIIAQEDIPTRYLTSREIPLLIELDGYTVRDVENVILWVSTDLGNKWFEANNLQLGEKEGAISIRYKVDSDGTYLLRTQVIRHDGTEDDVPVPGDDAEMVVIVDTEGPHLNLEEEFEGDVKAGDIIRMSWSVRDMNPKEDGVKVSIKWDSRAGFVDTHILEEGHLSRVIPENVDEVTFRFEVTDRAGMMTSVERTYVVGEYYPRPLPRPQQIRPPSENFQEVRQMQAVLKLALDHMPPSGFREAQLYVTEDNGGTWRLNGIKGTPGPYYVFSAPYEGFFGIFIRLVAKSGKASHPVPVNGETQPQLTLLVDATAPAVTLKSGIRKQHYAGENVEIFWHAEDAFMDEKGITLMVDDGYGLGYQPIPGADRIANTGRYVWRIPNTLHGSGFRFAIKATDMAKNETIFESPLEITIDPPENPEIGDIVVVPEVPPNYMHENPEKAVKKVGPVATPVDMAKSREYWQRGHYRMLQEDYREAVKELRESFKYNRGNESALLDLAFSHLKLNEYRETLDDLDQWNNMLGPNALVAIYRAYAHIALGEYGSALEELKRGVESPVHVQEDADQLRALLDDVRRAFLKIRDKKSASEARKAKRRIRVTPKNGGILSSGN